LKPKKSSYAAWGLIAVAAVAGAIYFA